jgi:ATP-binding cassette, subfamily B, multidrug efflux pump
MAKPQEEQVSKLQDRQLFWRLLSYLKPYRSYVFTAIPLITINAIIELIGLNITMVAVDLYLRPAPPEQLSLAARTTQQLFQALSWQPTTFQAISFFAGLFLLVVVTGYLFSYLQTVILNRMGQYIMYDMRKQVFAKFQQLPLQHYDKNPVGRLITRLTSDVDSLNELMTSGFVTLFSDVLTLAGIITFLFLVNWRLALVMMIVLPLMILVTTWFRKNATVGFQEVRIRVARLNSFLQEHISGISIVQLFNRELKEFRQFEKINAEHRDANVETIFYYAVFYPAIGWVSALGTALIIWYGGYQVLAGTLTLGSLIFFIQSTQRFYEPIQDISEKYNILQAAMAAAERVFNLLDTPLVITSPAQPQRVNQFRGEIEFRNVWFAYNDEDWILKDISFRIAPGQSVALVGHTGAGKSSITNLLMRFYDIQKGQILIDGIDIRQWDLTELRKLFGMVLQDVFLFSGSVANNINLGAEHISLEQIKQSAQEVAADTFINQLTDGYQSQLTERGSTLSVGQRQLLSFARALAFDPRILILDEATSSIDTETEILIQQAVKKLMADRTSLIIAHRLSTIQNADQIIVLHKGQMREIGNHQELIAQRGIYYKLYQLQYREGARQPV